MKRTCLAFLVTVFVALTSLVAEVRDWTSADGRKLRAEFVSKEGGKTTIRRYTDGRQITLELAMLSEADQKWVKEHEAATDAGLLAASEAEDVKNLYHTLITGKWERYEDKGAGVSTVCGTAFASNGRGCSNAPIGDLPSWQEW